jgi:hypothetical protein
MQCRLQCCRGHSWVLSRFGGMDAQRRKHEFGELRASTSACREYEPHDDRPWLSPSPGELSCHGASVTSEISESENYFGESKHLYLEFSYG